MPRKKITKQKTSKTKKAKKIRRRNPDWVFLQQGVPTDRWIDYRKDTGNTGSAGPQVKDKKGEWWSVNAIVRGNIVDVRDIRYVLPSDYKPNQIIKRDWL